MTDTILCKDKEDAKELGDILGWKYIVGWEFLDDGKMKLILSDKLENIKGKSKC